jgi:uncharacterized protein with PhoU and TrkA domain
VKVRPPEAFLGKTLRELDLPNRMSLTPITLRRGERVTINPGPDERLGADDELVLIGQDAKLELLDR